MTDPNNFLVNSDYPQDKVIFLASGSTSIGAFFSTVLITPIPHGLGSTPLPLIAWSTTSDFSKVYEMGSSMTTDNALTNRLGMELDFNADATNINLRFTNFKSVGYTLYYRIFCLERSDSTVDMPSTADQADNFILNTDLNYTKLFQAGIINLSVTNSYIHDLGYIPQVQMWGEYASGVIEPLVISNISNPTSLGGTSSDGAQVTTTNISHPKTTTSYTKVHYRIYTDTQA